jgi:sugar transferase EpsL
MFWYTIGVLLQYCTPLRYHRSVFYCTKRLLDIIVSSTMLVLMTPVLFILAITNWIMLGDPILFKQRRIGQHKKCFKILKLRSMLQSNPSGRLMLPEEIELSYYGTLLRRYSLDELPSLWNVLKGDMSLVGPRPLVPEFLTDSVPSMRHNMRPGLTGWAQVNGRNTLTWSEKFAYDVSYVCHPSYTLDIKILWLTIGVLCRAEHTQLATKDNFFP